MIRVILLYSIALVMLSGCTIFSSSQQMLTLASSNGSSQLNPSRRPTYITDHQAYPFNDAIPFFRPGDGDLVTSDFGWRRLSGNADFHCAIDVTARIGSPVFAVQNGQIVLKRTFGNQGGIVAYSSGFQFTYWHIIPSPELREGQIVRAGQQIGVVADWGRKSQLHYGIYRTGADKSPNARKTTNCLNPL